MTTAYVVETSVTVNNNSPIQDYVQHDDQTQPTFEAVDSLNVIHELRLKEIQQFFIMQTFSNDISRFAT